jgi:mannose-6-phosphate isomerase-like protein (cupin superfamily)
MRSSTARVFILGGLVAASALSLSAQGGGRAPAPLSTTPYDRWTADQLTKPGSLGNFGNHNASIQKREVGALPEIHAGFAHFMMFTGGEGSFTVGGDIVDGPDGKKVVKGGDTQKIVVGTMYHIPVNTAHWVVPNPGSTVTYWVTNINIEKP